MSLKNKVVIVTGAGSGIGAAVTLEALKEGAKVTAIDRNEEKLNQSALEWESATGNKPLIIKADVTNEKDAVNIINATLKEYGNIDVLVNNAGFGRLCSIESEEALSVYDSVMKTNIRAVIHLTHLVIPHLTKTKGNIVNVSSVRSSKPRPNFWTYCVSKAALDHFSRNMAVDLAPKGIRVNTVNPGPVATDFNENIGQTNEEIKAQLANITNVTLLGRYSEPKEIADVILFLASEKAKGITGANFVIDNGFLVK